MDKNTRAGAGCLGFNPVCAPTIGVIFGKCFHVFSYDMGTNTDHST